MGCPCLAQANRMPARNFASVAQLDRAMVFGRKRAILEFTRKWLVSKCFLAFFHFSKNRLAGQVARPLAATVPGEPSDRITFQDPFCKSMSCLLE